MSFAIISTALILTASSTARHRVVEGLKLTSLGSTFESGSYYKSEDVLLDDPDHARGDEGDAPADADFSDLACSPGSSERGGETTTSSSSSSSPATCSSTYGVDRSFPVHHRDFTSDFDGVDSFDREAVDNFYGDFMAGCYEEYEPFLCDDSEEDRIEMNLRQPASMYNYTTLGFHKARAPAGMMNLLAKFWNKNSNSAVANIPNETWDRGNTYTNHWSSPTKMLGLNSALRKSVWDASRSALEEWTGVELSPSSLYGVRVYTEGAVLAPHVDRTPLVISAVVNVAQDVDEPWPLELYGHDGRAYNVTMEAGDMVFYESHSVIHGRPFPLKGRHYANVFIHFEPLGHTLQHEERNGEEEQSLQYLYQQAWKKLRSKCQEDDECQAREDLNVVNEVPHYIVPGSEEERRWLQTHPKARLDMSKDNDWVKGLNAHTAASTGDLDALVAIAVDNPDALRHVDKNGWNALHEAARGGHVDIVKFLLQGGLDKDERTHAGNGGSPLWWAKKTHGAKHPVVQYLESIGAAEIPPDGHKHIKKG